MDEIGHGARERSGRGGDPYHRVGVQEAGWVMARGLGPFHLSPDLRLPKGQVDPGTIFGWTKQTLGEFMRILLVEDEKKVASFVEKGLREDGYSVDVAHDGNDGSMKAHVHEYDLLILDVMLPGKTGYEILMEVRRRESAVPVLLLTARDASEDVVRGLDAGADDYLTKPFSFDVLLARVRALVRRGGAQRLDSLRYEDVELDRIRHTAARGGRDLKLTAKEFQLLEHFLLHAQEVVRRTYLLEKVWDLHFDPMSNVVDVHVAKLRRKLKAGGESPLIHTIRGVGYTLDRDGPV
jgi:DNA-binding response OmpR family regulator